MTDRRRRLRVARLDVYDVSAGNFGRAEITKRIGSFREAQQRSNPARLVRSAEPCQREAEVVVEFRVTWTARNRLLVVRDCFFVLAPLAQARFQDCCAPQGIQAGCQAPDEVVASPRPVCPGPSGRNQGC